MKGSRPAHACPACDYQRGSSGRPQASSGEFTCLDCGNSWKEFSNAGTLHQNEVSGAAAPLESVAVDGRIFSSGVLLAKPYGEAAPNLVVRSEKSWNSRMVTGAAVLAIGGLVLAGIVHQSMSGSQTAAFPLQIGTINLQEQRNSSGGRVLTVSGQLTNLSSTGQKIPRISIVLRQSDGYEVFRWFHQSPVVVLPAGGDMGFASSVQLDNPGTVSAEAEFDRF